MTPQRLAAVDVGTNTVRMLAVEIDGDLLHVLDEYGEMTRLGGALVARGEIDPADAARTLACLRTCLERARKAGADRIEVAGTEVFRRAGNGRLVAAEFSRDTGHLVRILSPAEEAEAAYLGAVGWGDAAEPGPLLVLDVGGGSSEVVAGEGIILSAARSVPVGALTVTTEFLAGDPAGASAVAAARKALAGRLAPLAALRPAAGTARALAVGGSACAVGAWIHGVVPYDPQKVQGAPVTAAALEALIGEWAGMTQAERVAGGRLDEGRAQVVLGGAIVLAGIVSLLGLPEFAVSIHGLRHGLVLRRFLAA